MRVTRAIIAQVRKAANTEFMSRAFVNEDAGAGGPKRHYSLPARDDPTYDAAAAQVLLEKGMIGSRSSRHASFVRHAWPSITSSLNESVTFPIAS